MSLRTLFLNLLILIAVSVFAQNKEADTEALSRALEYFQSEKYHEALLIFQRLDTSYKLNNRYKAYIALCYYHDWDFKKATEYFDAVLPKLEALSPQERAVYYYTNGECHFQLAQYREAIPWFRAALVLCPDRDKGDNWFRLGFCYYFLKESAHAQGCFMVADYYYASFRNPEDVYARRQQIEHMVRGLRPQWVITAPSAHFKAPTAPKPTSFLHIRKGIPVSKTAYKTFSPSEVIARLPLFRKPKAATSQSYR